MVTLNPNSTTAFLQALKNKEIIPNQIAQKEEPKVANSDLAEFKGIQKKNTNQLIQNAKSANDAIGYLQISDSTYKKVQKELENLELMAMAINDSSIDSATKESLLNDAKDLTLKINQLQENAKFMGNELINRTIVYANGALSVKIEFFDATKIDMNDSSSIANLNKEIETKRDEIKNALSKISEIAENETVKSVGSASNFDFSKFDPNIFRNLAKGV